MFYCYKLFVLCFIFIVHTDCDYVDDLASATKSHDGWCFVFLTISVIHVRSKATLPVVTSATREFCYPCWTFTVKLYNFGCSYCVVTGCSQDRKEAQQQQASSWNVQLYRRYSWRFKQCSVISEISNRKFLLQMHSQNNQTYRTL